MTTQTSTPQYVKHVMMWGDPPKVICSSRTAAELNDCNLRISGGKVYISHPNLFQGGWALLVTEDREPRPRGRWLRLHWWQWRCGRRP